MAIARITGQDATNSAAASTVTATYPGATTKGNLLVACVGDNSGGNGDTVSGWISFGFDLAVGGNTGGSIFYRVATGTETTVTANNTGSGASVMEIAIYEYNGFNGVPTLDTATVNGVSLGSATAPTGTTAITSDPNELAIVIGVYLGTLTFVSWSNSFNLRNTVATGTTQKISTGDLVLTAMGPQSSIITISGATAAIGAGIATFKGVPVTGTIRNISTVTNLTTLIF